MSIRGFSYGIICCTLWGLFPGILKLLDAMPATAILFHRTFWAFVSVILCLLVVNRWHQIKLLLVSPRLLIGLTVSSVLIGLNWGIYIWAVNNHHIVDASLGYYMYPLLTALLGAIFLHERLRPLQYAALLIAATGTLYCVVTFGNASWVALSIASTFALYGMLRKLLVVDPLVGQGWETLMVTIILATLGKHLDSTLFSHLIPADLTTWFILMLIGFLTLLTLWLFVSAAKMLPLTIIGILFYITPTLIFLLGRFVYKEPVHSYQQIIIISVLLAIAIFSLDGFITQRRVRLKTQCAEH